MTVATVKAVFLSAMTVEGVRVNTVVLPTDTFFNLQFMQVNVDKKIEKMVEAGKDINEMVRSREEIRTPFYHHLNRFEDVIDTGNPHAEHHITQYFNFLEAFLANGADPTIGPQQVVKFKIPSEYKERVNELFEKDDQFGVEFRSTERSSGSFFSRGPVGISDILNEYGGFKILEVLDQKGQFRKVSSKKEVEKLWRDGADVIGFAEDTARNCNFDIFLHDLDNFEFLTYNGQVVIPLDGEGITDKIKLQYRMLINKYDPALKKQDSNNNSNSLMIEAEEFRDTLPVLTHRDFTNFSQTTDSSHANANDCFGFDIDTTDEPSLTSCGIFNFDWLNCFCKTDSDIAPNSDQD